MRKIVVLLICAVFATFLLSDYSTAFDKKDLEGQNFYTRTNLKAHGKTVFFNNLSKTKGFIPVGTLVMIKKVSKDSIKFELLEGDKEYKTFTLKAPSEYYDNYFVKGISEIELNKMSGSVKDNVKNMAVVPGMTKAEVYVSRGCPAFIGWGVKSWGYSMGQIMQSDTWYYNAGTSKIENLVIFENGVVSEIQKTIKKRK